jgi:hypothetical protein
MATIEIQGKTPVIMRGIRQLLKGLYEWLQIRKELKKLRKQLEDKRQDTMLQAAKQLSTSDRADVNDHIRHIEAYDKLLAGMPQHRIVPALMIAFLCVTVAGIASSLHRSSLPIWNRTKLVLTVQVEAVQLKLAKQMEWGPKLPLPLHQDMRLQRFTEIQVPGSLVKSPERRAKVDIEGGQLSLARLSLGEESIVHIESHHNGLGKVEISVTSDPHHGAHFSGELGLGGAEKVVIGSDDGAVTHRLYPLMEPPETVTFKADVDPKRLTSAQLWMQPKEALVFRNLQVGDPLSFSKEL